MSGLPAAALTLLHDWLPANDDPVRPLMQLATVDAGGAPDVRTVLLSSWDERGFTFHTDARSRKVEQLGAVPRAALALLWPELPRQLVLRGPVEVLTGSDLLDAYGARSDYLKRLAWVNTVELAARPAQERRAAWAAFIAAQGPSGLSAPDTWVGFRLLPSSISAWEADPDGPSHRTEFRFDERAWSELHLPG